VNDVLGKKIVAVSQPFKKPFMKTPYTYKEDAIIMKYVKDKLPLVGSKQLWVNLQNSGLINRTFESLRNRYHKTLKLKYK